MRFSNTPQPSQDNVSEASGCPSNDIDSNDNFSNNFNDQLDEISTDPLSDVSLNNISEKNAAENEKLLKASFVDLDAPARNKVQFKVIKKLASKLAPFQTIFNDTLAPKNNGPKWKPLVQSEEQPKVQTNVQPVDKIVDNAIEKPKEQIKDQSSNGKFTKWLMQKIMVTGLEIDS